MKPENIEHQFITKSGARKLKFIPFFLFILFLSKGLFSAADSYGAYCYPTLPTACNHIITNVAIIGSSLNNTSTCNSGTGGTIYPPGPTTTDTFQQGNTYSLSVTTNTTSIISAWLDYNNNMTFEPSEWINVSMSSITNVASIASFTIPFTALTTNIALRIRTRDSGFPNGPSDACTNGYLSGEWEQYTITIAPAPACTAPPVAGSTISTNDTVCPATQFTLSLQGAAIAQGLSQQWQSSANGTLWANISGAMGTNLTTTQSAATYYQCLVTCGGSTVASTPKLISMFSPQYYDFGTTLIFSEHFENWVDGCDNHDIPSINWFNTPFTGDESWRRQDEGFTTANWGFPSSMNILAPHTGNGAARFHSFSGSSLAGTLDLYLNCSNFSFIDFDFWYYKDQIFASKCEVYVSTNGGLSFSPALASYTTASPVWINKIINNVQVWNSPTTIIRFKDFGDCCGARDTGLDDLAISGILGTGDISSDNTNVAVLPNPSNGSVEIRCRNKNFTKSKLQLLDLTGRIVYTEVLQNNSAYWSQTMDWSGQAKGIYFVKLVSDTKVFTQKIVIE